VIRDREDFDWSVNHIIGDQILRRCPVLMSVVFGALEPVELARWVLEAGIDVRFQLQMHKYVWEPSARGV
jgi:7-carboxy-7-deazaguanine synthase